MARYIDADKLIVDGWHLERQAPSGKILSMMSIADVSTADVEEVVRCKDCVYRYSSYCNAKHERADMDFCSHGQRKTDN